MDAVAEGQVPGGVPVHVERGGISESRRVAVGGLERDGDRLARLIPRVDPGRGGYDYAHHGRAGSPSADFVPDGFVDRFCLLGPASAPVDRPAELSDLGVAQFALCLMDDQKESALKAYGSTVLGPVD